MEADALHDLTAAYALNALEPEEARRYEAHLARCERCRDEFAALSESASALAYATEAPEPPADLRSRILEQARNERPNVVPLRPRWIKPVAAVAAVAVCAAIALGIWAASLSNKLDRREAELQRQEQVAQILAQPGSRKIAFARGTLVVTASGRGALVLNKLAPPGRRPGRATARRALRRWDGRGRSTRPPRSAGREGHGHRGKGRRLAGSHAVPLRRREERLTELNSTACFAVDAMHRPVRTGGGGGFASSASRRYSSSSSCSALQRSLSA